MKLSAHLNSITGALEKDTIETYGRSSSMLCCFLISLLFNILVKGSSSGIIINKSFSQSQTFILLSPQV